MVLPGTTTSRPGKFNSRVFPWISGMLDDITDPMIGEHIWCFATQLAKTTCAIAVCGYYQHHIPSPVLVKYPTKESAASFSKEKLEPIINESPAWKSVMAEAKTRNSSNTIYFKKCRGGFIAMVGANAPSELRRRSCRVVIQDEIDSDAASARQEGDPVALADRRADNFGDAIFLKMSSPGMLPAREGVDARVFERGPSRIWEAFKQSDQCYFFVPCLHCKTAQALEWSQIKWTAGDGSDARYECINEKCKARWTDAERIRSIYRGEWRATAPFRGKRGRHLNGIYRLTGRKRHHKDFLHEFVAIYLEAKRSDETLKVWWNTFLALPYELAMDKVEPNALANRTEPYGPQIPNGACILAFAIDVQESPARLEAEIRAIGPGEESWGVEYGVFLGAVHEPEVWDQAWAWINQPRQRVDGKLLPVWCGAVDTGAKAGQQMAYDFCRDRMMRRVYAVKGRGGPGQDLVSLPRKTGVRKVRLYTVWTDVGKGQLYFRLKKEKAGPGFYHFPQGYGYTKSYFDGLTSEVARTKMVQGQVVRYFTKPPGVANEPLDINVYIMSAVRIARPNLVRLLGELSGSIGERGPTAETVPDSPPSDQGSPPTPTAEPPPAPTVTMAPPSYKKVPSRRPGWVRNW